MAVRALLSNPRLLLSSLSSPSPAVSSLLPSLSSSLSSLSLRCSSGEMVNGVSVKTRDDVKVSVTRNIPKQEPTKPRFTRKFVVFPGFKRKMIKQKRLDHWTRLRDDVKVKEKKLKFEEAKVQIDILFEKKRALREKKKEREAEKLAFWEAELERDRAEIKERKRRNRIFTEEQERVLALARREFLMCLKEDEGLWRTHPEELRERKYFTTDNALWYYNTPPKERK
eukprot:CAMPEP_0201513568 /NCGR_PEP_ID=MMETSP0161_2-20130828/5607_1 /ASSEMBLY_ACC=CAM_ASM_000251 /TAXON_ID=180227 /ORGANISM="Neoparamoeba aestuarina, Strain SoJaBio B1-5/56/2" /LENGTH=225 /DNA_ID=CAMNT_0047909849 /DNA_START=83 /DNA_END=760 /DNA_ORIENTATION=+